MGKKTIIIIVSVIYIHIFLLCLIVNWTFSDSVPSPPSAHHSVPEFLFLVSSTVKTFLKPIIRRKSPKIMSKCLLAACTRNRASTHSVHSLNSVGILGTLGTDTHTPIGRRLIGSCSYVWHHFLRNVLLLSVTSQSGSRFKTVQVNKQADDRCV